MALSFLQCTSNLDSKQETAIVAISVEAMCKGTGGESMISRMGAIVLKQLPQGTFRHRYTADPANAMDVPLELGPVETISS